MDSLLQRYLKKVRDDNISVDARGIMQVNRVVVLKMKEIFIDLTAKITVDKVVFKGEDYDDVKNGSDRLRKPDKHQERIEQKGIKIDELYKRHSKLVLLGDPGCGKTTLTKYLAFNHAEEYIDKDDGLIPIKIILRFLNEENIQYGIIGYIRYSLIKDNWFNENEADRLIGLFKDAFDQGKVIILLDGLDELREQEMKKMTVYAIEKLTIKYPKNSCIVTSRIIGYNTFPLSGGFQSAEIEPFNLEQMKNFFQKWLYAYEWRADIIDDAATVARAKRKADELIKQIGNNESIRILSSNPHLCTIIAIVNDQIGKLPEKKVELYRVCIDTFIFNWEMAKRRNIDDGPSLDKEETQGALEDIALYLHEKTQENRAKPEKLIEIITNFLKDKMGVPSNEAKNRAHRQLMVIREIAGLLIDRGELEYGFAHLTFQEYLTARAVTRRRKDISEYINRYLFNPRWREAIHLAASHQGQKDAESGSEFIESILAVKHQRETEMKYSFRIAFECMLDAKVEQKTFNDMFNQWVDLYLCMSYLQKLLLTPLDNKIEKICPDGVMDRLIAALKDNDWNVRYSAAEALGRIGGDKAVEPLITALKDKDNSVRYSAAQALGRIGGDKAVEPLIAALKDNVNSVRYSAAQALGSIGGDKAFEPLIAALKDEDYSVRSSAAEALDTIDMRLKA